MGECMKKEYKPCGCITAKVYSDVTFDILMPSNCQRGDQVVCSATDPKAFVDDGLNAGSLVTFTLAMTLALPFTVAVANYF